MKSMESALYDIKIQKNVSTQEPLILRIANVRVILISLVGLLPAIERSARLFISDIYIYI